jgi:hypothetical protein
MVRTLLHNLDMARNAYRRANGSATVEWTWLTGRVLVALVLIPAGLTVFSGYAGAGAVTAAGVAVLVYSVGLAWLLKKGLTNLTFKIGFAFDNVLVLAAWWWTVHDGFPASAQNDFWLALLPTLIVGSASSMSAHGCWCTRGWSSPTRSQGHIRSVSCPSG